MKILYVCHEYPPSPHGGIGTFVYFLARKLKLLGIQTGVVGYDAGAQEPPVWTIEEGVSVLRVPKPQDVEGGIFKKVYQAFQSRIQFSICLERALRDFSPDLVESFDWSGPLWSKPSCPLVVRLHGANSVYEEKAKSSKVLRFFEERNVKMADRLVAVSQFIGRKTQETFNLRGVKNSMTVIYNGTDTELFCPSVVPGLRAPATVVYVGNTNRRKGLDLFFQAIPKIKNEVPEATFSFFVRIEDPGSSPRIQELLSLLPEKLRTCIRFYGTVENKDLPEVYRKASVFVFPSLVEAFGLTCTEAMACGTAVIMTSLSSGPEIVENEVSGLLSDPRDPDAFAKSVIRVLQNPGLAESLGDKAREKAMERFSLETALTQNVRFYEEVVAASVSRIRPSV